ncbi:MAG: hypothetical protein P4M01_00240 [Acidobacteriota bacterium]|nr:hypothetical protein [Acidobacteriota bacterium]
MTQEWRAAPDAERRVRIAVWPEREAVEHAELWRALETLFPVEFDGAAPAAGAARVCFGGEAAAHGTRQPVFHASAGPGVLLAAGEMRFATSAAVPEAFRGLRLRDPGCRCVGVLPVARRHAVLATCDGHPVWTARHDAPLVVASALPLPRLAPGEPLRLHFRPAAWAALLPLLHWLRQVSEPEWQGPPPRASFVIDDPNLRRTRYGALDFHELATAARRENFHAAVATIPLDLAQASDAAVRVFRDNREHLSLLAHGNNHTGNELAEQDAAACAGLARQALRRMERFAERTGLVVERVMAAPHGACSATMASALAVAGFAAALISAGSLARWNPELAAEAALGMSPGWTLGGLPVLHRQGLRYVRTQAALAHFLGQPVIFTAHHGDCDGGLERLREAARECNAAASVRWMSPSAMSQSNYLLRAEREEVEVRMYSGQARVPLSREVRAASVTVHGLGRVRIDADRSGVVPLCEGWLLMVSRTAASLELEVLPAAQPLAARARVSPWARARRAMCEARDRMYPLFAAERPQVLD